MHTFKLAMLSLAVVLVTLTGQAVTLKTTLFSFKLDNGKEVKLPAMYTVIGDVTDGMKSKINDMLNAHAISMIAEKLGPIEGVGNAVKMGEVLMHHMVQAAASKMKEGGEAMVSAANGVLDTKHTETLFDFEAYKKGGELFKNKSPVYQPKIVYVKSLTELDENK